MNRGLHSFESQITARLHAAGRILAPIADRLEHGILHTPLGLLILAATVLGLLRVGLRLALAAAVLIGVIALVRGGL